MISKRRPVDFRINPLPGNFSSSNSHLQTSSLHSCTESFSESAISSPHKQTIASPEIKSNQNESKLFFSAVFSPVDHLHHLNTFQSFTTCKQTTTKTPSSHYLPKNKRKSVDFLLTPKSSSRHVMSSVSLPFCTNSSSSFSSLLICSFSLLLLLLMVLPPSPIIGLQSVNAVSIGGRSLRTLARSAANQTVHLGRSWPNLRFMRTFFRPQELDKTASASQQFADKTGSSIALIPTGTIASTPVVDPMVDRTLSGADSTYFDWQKLRNRFSDVNVFRSFSGSPSTNPNNSTNDQNVLVTSHMPANAVLFDSGNVGLSGTGAGTGDERKEEDEKEAGGFSNYLSSWFGSNPINNDRSIQGSMIPGSEDPLQSDKTLSSQSSSSSELLPLSDEQLFYQNPALLASGSIRAWICDRTMAIVRPDPHDSGVLADCELFDLDKRKKEAEDLLKKLQLVGDEVKFEQMMNVIEQCKQLSERQIPVHLQPGQTNGDISSSSAISSSSSSASSGPFPVAAGLQLTPNDNKTSMNLLSGIVPGTYWCGLGDSAKNYNDLGPRQDIDICCRAHDHCPVRLKSFRPGYGLFNFSFYTKSHCKCDRDFFQCLRKINNRMSNMIGNFFFNVLKVQCIDEELTCVQYKESSGKKECAQSKPMMQIKLPESKY